jgi:hypothetical protein
VISDQLSVTRNSQPETCNPQLVTKARWSEAEIPLKAGQPESGIKSAEAHLE